MLSMLNLGLYQKTLLPFWCPMLVTGLLVIYRRNVKIDLVHFSCKNGTQNNKTNWQLLNRPLNFVKNLLHKLNKVSWTGFSFSIASGFDDCFSRFQNDLEST